MPELYCRPPGHLFSSVPGLLISILNPLFLHFSRVSLSYFIPAVPMRECLGKPRACVKHFRRHTERYLFF